MGSNNFTVRQYLAGTPAFQEAMDQFKPVEDAELTDVELFPTAELVHRPTLAERTDWLTAAAQAFIYVAKRKETFTTDDIYGELKRHGFLKAPEPRSMGIAVQNAHRAHIMVDNGGAPIPSVRSECNRRPIRVYKSLIFNVL